MSSAPVDEAAAAGSATTVVRPEPSAKVCRRSRHAVARSAAGDRWMCVLVGLILLVGGTLTALLSYGVFGTGRAQRPLLDPVVVETLRSHPTPARIIAIAAGLLLAVIGLVWTSRSLRPERRPDLALATAPDTAIVITASAAADAVAGQAAALPGVARARARLVGDDHRPAVRLMLWLTHDADTAQVLRDLDEQVLTGARESLGVDELPVAVRVDLDTSGDTRRRVE